MSMTTALPDVTLAESTRATITGPRNGVETPTTHEAWGAVGAARASVVVGQEPSRARTLLDVFDATRAAWPTNIALEDGDRSLTFSQLDDEASDLAARLSALGIGCGDRVGVHLPSGTAELYIAVLGILRAGAAYVPAEFADPSTRTEWVFAEVDVCAVIGPHLTLRERHPGSASSRPAMPCDDCWIIFTSGSTGRPKPVAVTHRAAAAFVDAEARLWTVRPTDRVQGALSVAFDASCEEMWLAWRHGAALIATPRSVLLSAETAEEWIVDRQITVVSTVPSLASLWSPSTWSRLRLVILGGESCPEHLARQASGQTELWNTYGPTEATVVTTAARLGVGKVTIGAPLSGWRIAVVDESERVVPLGAEGELVVAGVGLARYLDDEVDRRRFAPLPAAGWDRAYRTGDRVRLTDSGLEFVGRTDDQVKINGRRVELGEVDAVLGAVPGVVAGVSAVRETLAGTQVLVGYIVGDVDLAVVQREVARRLPAGLTPLLVAIPEVPRGTSGKIARAQLPWPVERSGSSQGDLGMFGELGAWVTDLVHEHLGPVDVGPDADFFELGGNSLAAAQFVSAVRTRFPTIGVADLYSRPQLGEFTGWLVERQVNVPGAAKVDLGRSRLRPVQTLGVLATFLLVSPQYFVPLFAFDHFVHRAWAPTIPLWALLSSWLVFMSLPGRLLVVAGVKWLLLGRVRPGRYPRGGRIHLSIWFVERVAEAFNLEIVNGTSWAVRYARLLGAKIAQDVQLGTTPPILGLLQVDQGTSIEAEVDLLNWAVEGDDVVIGALSIGRDVRVGARSCLEPGTVVGDNVEIEPGSALAGTIEPGGRWGGAPSMVVGSAGDAWPTDPGPRVSARSRRAWNALYGASMLVLPLFSVVAALPALFAVMEIDRTSTTLGQSFWRIAAWSPLLVVVTLTIYAGMTVWVIAALRRRIRPGLYPSATILSYQLWLASRIVESSRGVLSPLYGSIFTPWWLRRLGASIGRDSEITTPVGLPWLLTVGDSSFVADDVLFAPTVSWRGWLRIDRVVIGSRSFVGNSAILDSGTVLGDDVLIAVAAVAPQVVPDSTSWLGNPAFEIPRTHQDGPSSKTYSPGARLKLARGTIETVRGIVPLVTWVVVLEAIMISLDATMARLGIAGVVLLTPVILSLAGCAAWFMTVALKWLIVGRYRVGEHPLWSIQVWRGEFVDAICEQVAGTWLIPYVVGTAIFNQYLRTLGARIGTNVWCDTSSMTEFDLVTLHDDALVGINCDPQTHLFHDRMLSTGPVCVGRGATVGTRSVLLPHSELGERVIVHPRSLVMRGEVLAPRTVWHGTPVIGR